MLEQARQKQSYQQLLACDLFEYQPVQKSQLICAADVLIYVGELAPLLSKLVHWLTDDGIFAATLELTSDAPLVLKESGRFQHSLIYLQQRCEEYGLDLLEQQTFPLRREGDLVQSGLLFLLKRSRIR